MTETFDFIITGGTLLLPGGPAQTDVGVRAGRIAAIGKLGARRLFALQRFRGFASRL